MKILICKNCQNKATCLYWFMTEGDWFLGNLHACTSVKFCVDQLTISSILLTWGTQVMFYLSSSKKTS